MLIHECVQINVNHTQVVVEKVEEHQHAAAHDYKNTDHDGGDVNRLFVLLLCRLVPLQLKVASGGKQTRVNLRSLLDVLRSPEPSEGPGGLLPLSLNSVFRDLASCQSGRGDRAAVHQRCLPSAGWPQLVSRYTSQHTIRAPKWCPPAVLHVTAPI